MVLLSLQEQSVEYYGKIMYHLENLQWDHWKKVLFSDESKFNLRSADGRERVWRKYNKRYAQCCFDEITPYEGGGGMV